MCVVKGFTYDYSFGEGFLVDESEGYRDKNGDYHWDSKEFEVRNSGQEFTEIIELE